MEGRTVNVKALRQERASWGRQRESGWNRSQQAAWPSLEVWKHTKEMEFGPFCPNFTEKALEDFKPVSDAFTYLQIYVSYNIRIYIFNILPAVWR